MQINKNIPVANHFNRKYDFGAMQVGDSVELDNIKLRYAIFSALRWYNQKNNTTIRITTRKSGEGVTFWRVS